jgi:hypothetical protein
MRHKIQTIPDFPFHEAYSTDANLDRQCAGSEGYSEIRSVYARGVWASQEVRSEYPVSS